MTLTSTSFEGGGELYLSIEAGVDKYRLAVLDEKLEVLWTEQVNLDLELPEYKLVSLLSSLSLRSLFSRRVLTRTIRIELGMEFTLQEIESLHLRR